MTKIFFSIAIVLSVNLQSQVIINLQLPPAGITVKSQLWSLSLLNTGNDEPDVQVEILMSDVMTNQPVLSGSSRVIRLTKGVRLLQTAELSPIVYNVLNSAYNIDASPNGFLPIGVFTVCYRVTKIVSDQTEQLAEECETINIEPLSPPMLQLPFNEEQGELPRPIFMWLPPMPYHLFHNLLYDLVLVEVAAIQTSGDAIQQNIPVYQKSSINDISQPYPAALPELDTSKLYAWQVTAKSDFNSIAKSEIFTFRVKPISRDSSVVKHMGVYYAKLKREMDASFTICKGILHFEYFNENNDVSIHCTVTDISHPARKKVALDSTEYAVLFGQNFMDMDFLSNNGFQQKHIYLLEVVSSKNERWYLKFEFKKPD